MNVLKHIRYFLTRVIWSLKIQTNVRLIIIDYNIAMQSIIWYIFLPAL